MKPLKTQSVFVSQTQKNISGESDTHSAPSNTSQSLSQTFKLHLEEDKNEMRTTKKISSLNPHAYAFPSFYKKEIKISFIMFIFWICVEIGATAGILLLLLFVSWWLAIILVPTFFIISASLIVYADRFYHFRSEAKTINFKESKASTLNIQKLYKRLKVGHINVNWLSGLTYAVSGIVFLVVAFTFVAVYGSWSQFGKFWTYLGKYGNGAQSYDITYFTISLICAIAFFGTILLQFSMLIFNYIRTSRIENFYGFMIIPQEDIDNLKKKKNRRDLIIFLCIVITVIFAGFVIYKLLKRKHNKTVVQVQS